MTLHAAPLPPIGPQFIDAATDSLPAGLRHGQTLRAGQGGVVPDNFDAGLGSVLNVQPGGEVGDYLHLVGSELSLAGGNVGDGLKAFDGSTIHLTGGSIGHNMIEYAGSEIQLSSGSIGDSFRVEDGGTVNVTGGSIGRNLILCRGSAVTLAGGTQGYVSFNGATLVVKGGEFRVNGVPTGEQPLWLQGTQVLSGIYADGTPFRLTGGNSRTVLLEEVDLPPIGPTQLIASSHEIGFGIRQGQSLRVDQGGVVPDHFNVGRGSAIHVEAGGIIGENLRATAARVTIAGGAGGEYLAAFDGTTVTISAGDVGDGLVIDAGSSLVMTGGALGKYTIIGIPYGEQRATAVISGGEVGDWFRAYSSEVSVSGGTMGSSFSALQNSIVNISGGTFGAHFYAIDNSMVTISGGSFDDDFRVTEDATVNLVGRQFILDGVDVTDSLLPNVPLTIALRDLMLSGILADGSPFHFDLDSNEYNYSNYFDPSSTLTITLMAVPEPCSALILLSLVAIVSWVRPPTLICVRGPVRFG